MSGAPCAELSRRYRFSASHRLHVDHLPAERNRALFGKCNNPFGHGHNYTMQVTLHGPVSPDTGMVVNLSDLDAFVRDEVLERFDSANLNEEMSQDGGIPSTENLAALLWQLVLPFAAVRAPVQLRRIRVEETSKNAFDFYGNIEGAHNLQPRKDRHAA